MDIEHLFARNEKLPSWWANAIGHGLSVLAHNFVVSKVDATHVKVAAGADEAAAAIGIEGRLRWVEADVPVAHPGGAAGTYDLFVTAADDNIVNVPAPFTDATDRSFALAVVAHGGAPAGVAIARKVAEVGWDGAAITWIHQLVPASPSHHVEHEPGGADALTDLTDASFAAANKDGAAGVASLRTLGAGATQATAGNDARLSNARTPTAHAASHAPGGSDALAADSAAGTASLRSLGPGATQAAPGNDARLTDARTPVGHHGTHEPGGTDAMAVDAAAATGSLRTLGPGATQAAPGNDARLANARTPTAHAATHQPGGTDAMAVDAAAGTGSLRTLGPGAAQAAPGNDARLSDARAPTGHHGTHEPGGADAMAVDAAAGTGSLRTLGPGAAQAAPGNDARLSNARAPTGHHATHEPGGTDAMAADQAAGTASLRTLGVGATQAAAGNDARLTDARAPTPHEASHDRGGTDALAGHPPVASIIAYAGSGDPAGGDWVIADGRLIDRTTYAAFFAAVGHAYNGGVDPGANKVRIPDKRGKQSIGAINMGTPAGSGANDNAHAQVALGAKGGEAAHTLSGAESGLAAHGHGVNDPGHAHTADSWSAVNDYPFTGTDGSHSYTDAAPAGSGGSFVWLPYVLKTTGVWSYGVLTHTHTIESHTTGLTVQNAGAVAAGAAHNNLGPYEADSYLVRIA